MSKREHATDVSDLPDSNSTAKMRNVAQSILPSGRGRIMCPTQYERIQFGRIEQKSTKRVTLAELYSLASCDFGCKVTYFSITLDKPYQSFDQGQFFEFCQEHSTFLSQIDTIDFSGTIESLKKCFPGRPPNLRRVELPAMDESDLSKLPDNVQEISVGRIKDGLDWCVLWPHNIKHLDISNGDVIGFELPPTLHTCKCSHLANMWLEFPDPITKLHLDNQKISEHLRCPVSLVELSITRSNLPKSLRKQCLPVLLPMLKILNLRGNNIKTLTRINLPATLEVLNILQNRFVSIKLVRFPPNLKELDISDNRIRSWKGITFPNVTSLNISRAELSLGKASLPPVTHSVNLPSNIEVFKASGWYNIDWNSHSFPHSLKSLTLSIRDPPKNLPPNLKTLTLAWRTEMDPRTVNFPHSLHELRLNGPTFMPVRIDSPNLKVLVVDQLQIAKIPESVTRLCMGAKTPGLEVTRIPSRVTHLTIPFPIFEYPDSVEYLTITQSKVAMTLPRYLKVLEVNDSLRSFKVPGVEVFYI